MSAPEVKLEVHGGKSQFYIGERIELDLVFRNTTPNPYMLNNTIYGDLADSVQITPTNGWMRWQSRSGHDYARVTELGATELRIPMVLNEGFVFKEPGHFEVCVTTDRLSQGGDLLHIKPHGPVTTNEVGIDLVPMPADVEAEQLKSLMSEIGFADLHTRAGSAAHKEAISRLATLQGDGALRAKIRLIVAEDGDMRQVTREALASTRSLPLQLSLLEAAWKDPAIPPVYDLRDALQETRALLRGQTLPGFVMAGPAPDKGKAAKAAEEHKADMEELLRSLPQRSGESRAQAAYYMMVDRSLPAEDLAAVKPVALEEFTSMNETEQHMLLETAWPAIRDTSLTPVLRAMLSKSPTDKDAIARLIELDPQGAKDYVIRAVCDRHRYVPLEAVAALPDATLPEVDGCLGSLLRVPTSNPNDPVWKARVELAGRFASASILPAVRQGWKDPAQDSAVLPLLLRYSPEEAVSLIQERHNQDVLLFYETNSVFKARAASFPAQLTKMLRHQLQDGPDDQVGTAAYELSQGGAPEDCFLIEQRLAKLRADWSSRVDEVTSAAPDSPAAKARQLEVELMSDLLGSKVWTLGDIDAAQLALGCLSDQCRQYGKRAHGDFPF